MKRIFLLFSLSVLLLIGQSVYGQDYVFRVLANKGSNQVKKSGSSQATPLKTGSKLMSGDQIIAVSGTYIGLVHRSGKTMELRTPGTHSVDDLEGKVSKGTASVASRYMSFVVEKMSEENRDVNRNYRSNLNATGAVERATGSAAIKVRLRDSKNANKVFGNSATIRWEELANTSAYIVTVKNIFDQIIFAIETPGTKVNLDFNHERLASERFIIINVKSKDNEELRSRDFGIQRISPTQAKELSDQLNRLKGELSEPSALNNVIFASFYEENGLFIDALTEYEKAVELSPDVHDYKALYEEFVLANGIGN